MGVGTARAKLLLLGEHAAVHGHPAVGLTLPWTLTVTHTPAEEWNLDAWREYAEPVRRLVARLGELAAERGLPPPPPGRFEARSDIVPSAGFGSSAALCAALVNVFYPGLDAAAKDELAWRAEFLFHGTPSGIDTGLTLREGWWAFEPGVPGEIPARPRALARLHLPLLVGSVVRDGDTKTLVASVSRRLEADDQLARRHVNNLGALAGVAATMIDQGTDGAELAPLVRQARTELSALGLETPPLTAVIDAALARPGALAGKLSGAGGGGAFFVLFEDELSARAAAAYVRNSLPDALWRAAPLPIVP